VKVNIMNHPFKGRCAAVPFIVAALLVPTPVRGQATVEPIVDLELDLNTQSAYGGVTLGSDGALYGISGNEYVAGGVYRVAADGTAKMLRRFATTPTDIGPGVGRLVEGVDGNFYGLAFGGAPSSPPFCAPGVIF
jgi:hypothetical protein